MGQSLERLVSPMSSFLTLFSGWIPIWGVEVRHVYLLALASKICERGSPSRGTLWYSNGRRWPNIDGANSCPDILLAFSINQVIQPLFSTQFSYHIISIDAEKAFDKSQHPFTIKTLQKAGIEGTYLNIRKAIYNKPTANLIHNGKKIESISFKIRNKTRVPTFTTTIQHSFGSFGHSNQSRKRNKSKLEKKK